MNVYSKNYNCNTTAITQTAMGLENLFELGFLSYSKGFELSGYIFSSYRGYIRNRKGCKSRRRQRNETSLYFEILTDKEIILRFRKKKKRTKYEECTTISIKYLLKFKL